jgi:tetratricopeptide (TPR) repeat protein
MNPIPLNVSDALQRAVSYHQAGRLRDAEGLYRAILREQPKHAEALHFLGLIAAQVGRFAAAIDLIKQAIAVDRSVPAFHCSLGDAAQELDDLPLATSSYVTALRLFPAFPGALFGLGNVLRKQGKPDAAIQRYEQALAIFPNFPEALSNLGNLLKERGNLAGARTCYEQALSIRPDFADAPYNLGGVLEELGEFAAAADRYQQALRHRPDFADAHYNLGNVLNKLGKPAGAQFHFRQALALTPNFPEASHNLGLLLLEQGELDAALKLVADTPQVGADLLAVSADALMKLGRLDEATAALETAIRLEPPGNPRFFRGLSRLCKFTDGDPHFLALQKMAEDPAQFTQEDQIALHLALGKAYEDVKQPEQGFPHYLAANALVRQGLPYDEAATLAPLEAIRSAFTPEFLQKLQGNGHPSARPIFVLGMPRSGSTLVEQILGSHPDIFAAGELNDLDQLSRHIAEPDGTSDASPAWVSSLSPATLHALGTDYIDVLRRLDASALRVTDKMPSNFRLIGLIHLMLPNAKIIHTKRNAVDTCLSCFTTQFANESQPFSNDLGELGRYWRAYDRLMTHWRDALPPGTILDVHYEDVVADLEGQARRIVDYVGLAWDDDCLSFHTNTRPVLTASAAQVRRPLYQSSVGRWHAYRDLLQPLLDALEV